MRLRLTALLVPAALLALATQPASGTAVRPADAANLLTNPTFSGPLGARTIATSDGTQTHFGAAAATGWNWWATGYHTVTTDILPSTRPGAAPGETMLHFTSDSASADLNQEFCPFNAGPAHARSSVWVYALSGAVAQAAGNGGGISATGPIDTTPGVWVQLPPTAEENSPVNEYNVRPWDPQHTATYYDFYVTAASVTATSGASGCGS
jgi:hypothetical protein